MIRFVLVAAMIVFLQGWPSLLAAAESPCTTFPAGSLSYRECVRTVSKLQEEARLKENLKQILEMRVLTGLEPWLCDPNGAVGISGIAGTPGGRMTGVYQNLTPNPTRGIALTFQFYGQQGGFSGQVQTPVTPGALGPGQTGAFGLNMPGQKGDPQKGIEPWACFRLAVTELAQ
jgi:hypothetical protein